MNVSYRDFYEEKDRQERELNRQIGLALGSEDAYGYVHLENVSFSGPVKMAVNWSALGTVSPEGTRAFAEWLSKAADAAEGFKYNGCEIEYGKGE